MKRHAVEVRLNGLEDFMVKQPPSLLGERTLHRSLLLVKSRFHGSIGTGERHFKFTL